MCLADGRATVPVADPVGWAYPARVSFRRILSLLLLAALVLAPAGMMGGSAAMAMDGHAGAGMSHDTATAANPCHADQSQPGDQAPDTKQVPGSCCVMMCVAIPAVGGELAVHMLPRKMSQPLPLASDPHGLAPEAEPPPPRFS